MTIPRSRVWRFFAPLNLLLVGFVLFFAGLRIARPQTVFYYTEGPVLGSLAALESGDLPDLYPADGWLEPPLVLTLYPPVYFVGAAALDRMLGSGGTFTGLRIVSAAALLGLLALLGLHTLHRRAPPAWTLALAATLLLTPGVYRLAGGAQADILALMLTWVGITAALGTRDARVRRGVFPLLAAAAAFFFAFFSKQSFVAAPAALTVALLLERRVRSGAIFAVGLAGVALLGVFLLDATTSGGYLANTLGALTGASGWTNLVSSLRASGPLQWLPVVATVLLASRGQLRLGFPEIYLVASTALHTIAMLKTGSSANYLVEPTFALLLLAVIRGSLPGSETASARAAGHDRSAWTRSALPVLLAATFAVTAIDALLREARSTRAWLARAGQTSVADFEGYPLVDALFFPAVLERGGRPWLNDPFAFGALEETGQWDPSRLVSDLESRTIPFALTLVNVGTEPAPPGVGTQELLFAYFWRSRPVWTALTGSYDQIRSGPLTLLTPRDEQEP
ncbi:MAG: hypothetical protein KAI98_07245 [Gemmatimonadetes bacterium]|nr:hypothetical protein [Gemmatimonadota bacterium]